jgi:hypothetical protein
MKLLILDESKTQNFFVYGGVIIDSEILLKTKEEIRGVVQSAIGKTLPDGFELKRSLNACNEQIFQEIEYLFEGEDSRVLNYSQTDGTSTLSSNNYFTYAELKSMHGAALQKAVEYGEAIKYIAFIFPSLPSGNPEEVLDRYILGIRYCVDTFERYLSDLQAQGMVLVDRLGSEAGKPGIVNQRMIEWQAHYPFRLSLFLPQIISENIFTLPNVMLGIVGEFFENTIDPIPSDLLGQVKVVQQSMYRAGIYPVPFNQIHKEKLNFL